jgi:tRNA pseudouridine38-40 synthase
MKSEWQAGNDEWFFDVQANAFLYRMVRRMVYIQTIVAQGKLRVDAIRRALDGQEKLPAGLALPNGLTLVEVTYPSFDNLEKKDI